jgi:lambda family phage portal protein
MPTLISRARAAFDAFKGQPQKRGYDAVKAGRLYADWFAQATSSDTEIRGSFRKLVDRSRDLERNNDYQRGFLFACERNVLGAIRLDLRMDAGEYLLAKGKPPTWEPDRAANIAIENAWVEWGKKGTCTICGRYSWRDVKRLCVRAVPRDGNIIIRKIRDPGANRFGFALQIWEIDHLDIDRFEVMRNGNQVRFGIESDAYSRPVAYWLKGSHPGDVFNAPRSGLTAIRVPASDLYHVCLPDRAEQSLGVPWVVSAITRLRQLGAFEEAATIAARLGASKAGFFKQVAGANGEVGEFTGGTSASGNPIMDAAPGTFEALPQGWDLASWSPEYPNIETGDFRKAMLRGVATSIQMSYTTLGNDLESVNFSSARVGLFEEREAWKSLQTWFAEGLWEPIFSDWLESSMAIRAVVLPLAKFAKFNRPIFKSRRWPFIKPGEEIQAAKDAIAMRLTSRSQVIEENGGDRDDVFLDNKADEEFAEEIGLTLTPPDPQPESFGDMSKMPATDDTEKPDDADQDDSGKAKVKVGRNHVSVTIHGNKSQPTPLAAAPAPVVIPPPVVNITVPPASERDQLQQKAAMNSPPATIEKTATIERDAKGKPLFIIVKTVRQGTNRFAIGSDDRGQTTLVPSNEDRN